MKKEIWDDILNRLRTMPQDEFNKFIKDTEKKFGELTEIINRPSNSNNGMELTSAPESRACTCVFAKLPHYRSVSSERGTLAVSLSLEVNKTCPIHKHWFTLDVGA
jgi:hypothetical protein